MISGVLPRQAWSNARSKEAREESFALAYLARYSNSLIPTRAYSSFLRAWGMDSIDRVPAVVDGRPAYCIAYWPSSGLNRITIAIEGMRTTSQLWAAWTGYNSVLADGGNGRVFHAWKAHANTIYANLMASGPFLNVFNRWNTAVTLTGFSLGAAVAEYLAFLLKTNHPTKTYRLVKFACPRVGDSVWARGAQLPEDRLSYYVHGDPIDVVPLTTMTQLQATLNQGQILHTMYARNEPYYRFALDGTQENRYNEDTVERAVRVSISARGAIVPSNPWWSHDADCYRMIFWNLAAQSASGDRKDALRFRYLEFDDDNAWQINQQEGAEDYAGLRELLGSPPADVPIPSDPDMEFRLDANARAHTVPQNPMPSVNENARYQGLPRGMWTPRRPRDF